MTTSETDAEEREAGDDHVDRSEPDLQQHDEQQHDEQQHDEQPGRQPAEPDDETPAYRPWQRLAISALIMAVLLSLLASAAPDSTIKNALSGALRPFVLVTALDQRWGVFAPNPRLETSNVLARVERADGTVGTYPLDSGAGLSEYWNYRWRKYGEQLWTNDNALRERAAFSRWVIEQDHAAGHQPTRVTLIRVTRPNLAPGPGPDEGVWSEIPFSTTTVNAR